MELAKRRINNKWNSNLEVKNFKTNTGLLLLLGILPCLVFSQGSTANLLYNNGDVLYVQSGALLHVQGDVINKSGSTLTNNGLLNVEGDITNNGAFKTDGSVGEGTVRLIGNSTMSGSATAGTQTLSGTLSTAGTASFYNLVIDLGTTGQSVTLNNDITVTGSLVWNGISSTANTYSPSGYPATLGNSTIMQVRGTSPVGTGIVYTGANYVYVTNTSATAVAGYSATGYVNGYVKRFVTGNTSYDFPVGRSYYELANISFTGGLSGTTYLIAGFTEGTTTQPVPTVCLINGTKMNALLNGGYWTIHPDVQPTGGSTYTATLYERGFTNAPSAGTTSVGGIVTPAQQLGLVKRVNGSSSWLGCGPTVYGNPSTDQGYGEETDNATISGGVATVVRTGVPAFSDFAIGLEENNYHPLPVQLEYFTAQKDGDHTSLLKWATASEIDNDHFEVERSADAATWVTLGQVKGAGTTIQEQHYSYIDANALNGVNYYRLKQVDIDGNFVYTNIEEVTFDGGAASTATTVTMFPNPLNESGPLTIQLSNSAATITNVSITNAIGQVVSTGTSSQTNVIQLTDLNLAAGVYAISVFSSDSNKPHTSLLVIKK